MKAPVESPGFRARALFFFFSGLRTAYRQSAASVRAVDVSTIRADHQRAAKNDPEPRPHLSCRALFLVQEVQHMPRGRRKGSTGTYFRWPPFINGVGQCHMPASARSSAHTAAGASQHPRIRVDTDRRASAALSRRAIAVARVGKPLTSPVVLLAPMCRIASAIRRFVVA